VNNSGSPIIFSGDLLTSANLTTKKQKAKRPTKLPPIRQPIVTFKNELGKSSRGAFQAFRQRNTKENMRRLSPILEAPQEIGKDSKSGLKTPSLQFLPLPPAPNKEIPVPPAPKKKRPGRLKPLDRGIVKNTSLLFSLDH
tara:strand:- start:516 stop:935 length:420 start_codon:yes stop_codon:yes gene_type:complete